MKALEDCECGGFLIHCKSLAWKMDTGHKVQAPTQAGGLGFLVPNERHSGLIFKSAEHLQLQPKSS